MDNEHSNASPSAAAVADGVSSETKSSNSNAFCGKTVNTAPTMAGPCSTSTNLKLLIKASSQQFEDVIIESDLLWTVKRLKAHLSVVYPSKPVSILSCHCHLSLTVIDDL